MRARSNKNWGSLDPCFEKTRNCDRSLVSPAISLEKRKAVLGAVITRLKLTKISSNCLQVLLDNFRMEILEEIATAFKRLSEERLGIVRVEVKAADPLTEAQQKALQKIL